MIKNIPAQVIVFLTTDASTKKFALSQKMGEVSEKALLEVEKCILLCANCHRTLHNEEENDD